MIHFTAASRCVIVTAHPDDETLWCAGLPIRYPDQWSVICCSIPRTDPIRAWKFFDACAVLGVEGRLFPQIETAPDQFLPGLDMLELDGFDLIVTHNSSGEYGHLHHKQIHHHVKMRWPEKTATIGYRTGGVGREKIELTDQEYARKLEALKKYDHVLPYGGRDMPKWEALLYRYGTVERIDFRTETYDAPAL